jgi:hypothetical protein
VPDDGATHMTYAADNFQPAGDLLVDYQLPNPDAEVRWWTFNGDATVAPPENTRERNEEVDRLQREIDADTRPYVVFAVRPDLPAWTEGESRDYVFVVDSSQSMVGERFDRAKELVSTLIREMDRRDRFAVLACDIECRAMNEQLQSPSRQLADQTAAWLGQIEPAGATDLTTALSRATALGQSGDHMRRVIYLGDGIASTGHRRASSLAAEVRDIVGPTLSVSTVGIGGDADTQSLAAIARAGNGHYVPYVPGQRLTGAAMAVLESTYGTSLTNARIEVPEGVVDVSPRELPTVRAGEEVIVVGPSRRHRQRLALRQGRRARLQPALPGDPRGLGQRRQRVRPAPVGVGDDRAARARRPRRERSEDRGALEGVRRHVAPHLAPRARVGGDVPGLRHRSRPAHAPVDRRRRDGDGRVAGSRDVQRRRRRQRGLDRSRRGPLGTRSLGRGRRSPR